MCKNGSLSGGHIVDKYYASEVDQYAIEISKKNWPKIYHIGDVKGVMQRYFNIGDISIDLLIGGSPCQDLSQANSKRKGLAGERSGLFYEYLRILKEVKPKYFILENVASMSQEDSDEITKELGIFPVMINSALVSAQDRKRLFWVGVKSPYSDEYFQLVIPQPQDKGLVLRDIIDLNVDRKWQLPENITKTEKGIKWDTSGKGYASQQDRASNLDNKHPTVPTSRTNTKCKFVADNGASVGILNWNEIERLQGLPDGYTDLGDNNRQEKRGACLGNGFNVDVIVHILSFMKF